MDGEDLFETTSTLWCWKSGKPGTSWHFVTIEGQVSAEIRFAALGRTGGFLMIHGDCSSRGCYAMTDEQIAMLNKGFPEAAGKEIYTLKQFAGIDGDIEDPAGRDEQFFANCRDEIKACLERAIERLA